MPPPMRCRCGNPATHWLSAPPIGAEAVCWHCMDRRAKGYQRRTAVNVVTCTPLTKQEP